MRTSFINDNDSLPALLFAARSPSQAQSMQTNNGLKKALEK